MQVIGITGGIGSGKSEVLHFLSRQQGVKIVEADRLAHRLMEPGEEIFLSVVEAFGKEILSPEGSLDREKLGRIVFQDPEKLELLNHIVHPGVKRYIRKDIRDTRKEKEIRLYVIEAALLIQDGYKEICYEIWYVHVPVEQRIERLLSSRGGTREKWEQVMAAQPEDSYFQANSDRSIENDGSTQELYDRILRELHRLFPPGDRRENV